MSTPVVVAVEDEHLLLDVTPKRTNTNLCQLFRFCLPKTPAFSPVFSVARPYPQLFSSNEEDNEASTTRLKDGSKDLGRPVDEIEFEQQDNVLDVTSLPELYGSDVGGDDDDDDISESIYSSSYHQNGYARILMNKQQELFFGFFQMLVSLVFMGTMNGAGQKRLVASSPSQQQEEVVEKVKSDPQLLASIIGLATGEVG